MKKGGEGDQEGSRGRIGEKRRGGEGRRREKEKEKKGVKG